MKAIIAFGALALAGLSTATHAGEFDANTDIIVFGTVDTLRYESFDDDLTMDGQFTARLTITRVVKGRPPSSTLTIKYIAHTDRPADYVGRYHLRRSKNGIWLACKGRGGRGYICQ